MDFQPYDHTVEEYVQKIDEHAGDYEGLKAIVIEIMKKAHKWGEQAVWAFRSGQFVDDVVIECGAADKPVFVDAKTGKIVDHNYNTGRIMKDA